MTAAFFSDTTVLVNFEVIDRWDVLSTLVKDGGAWVASVENECRDWVRDYPTIHTSASGIFGEAIRPDSAEHIDTRVIRDAMANPADDHPRKHLGEAETIAILQRRFPEARFVTDDRAAFIVATASKIRCYGTGDLLFAAQRSGLVTEAERGSFLAALRDNGNYPQSYV
ncbi:hypothetical protein [Aeromicrobium ginsengisoli]|uniref:PIN domain-containing protein n=1 Tax=Aeromicrobium ginsengisoli TaxID=363867 RepID=A0A5M4FHE1_9ACTN|nr:hypothetical protein [Aeromicrobium ginsengisoli]KAA1399659.1 hypothetical protein ESP70_002540 [Aeromicrobium ginsengisoli]